ncbi:uncharacterized protein LOC110929302 isoform X1 [Helianthus annuus]|uniref:uncharacterized protein LOC110929302 isoform X1 n=1 Tax=Helianthus annuus TaxID=4232 RepID=UPI000B8FA7E1|nr:uncharacterized protein LOC110929302 isoform X1 [Helianthus annuus]
MQLGFRWRRWKEPRLHTTKMEMESFYGRFRPDLRRCQVYVPISSQLRYWNQILHLLDDSRTTMALTMLRKAIGAVKDQTNISIAKYGTRVRSCHSESHQS